MNERTQVFYISPITKEQLGHFVAAYAEQHDVSNNLSAVLRALIFEANEKLGNPASFETTNKEFIRVNMKRLRREADLTQKELAKAAGLALATVHDTENMRYTPTRETLEAIAAAFTAKLGRDITAEALGMEPRN